jgi:hypothetical protein
VISVTTTSVIRSAYQASLDIRLRLAATDPANTQWQRDLSISHNNPGDVAAAAENLAARTTYQASLESPCSWPPPTPPTRNGSGTCRARRRRSRTLATARKKCEQLLGIAGLAYPASYLADLKTFV